MSETKGFILASGSPQRRALLAQIGYEPQTIISADIDETPLKKEKATAYVKRIASEKAMAVAAKNKGQAILAADTVIVIGAKIVQKAQNDAEQEKVMRLLSGKTHRVLSGVCVIGADGKISVKCVSTRVVMKKLSEKEIKDYVASQEWVGCAGYRIEGLLGGLAKKIIGSYSGVVGLPLYEAKNMLNGAGVK